MVKKDKVLVIGSNSFSGSSFCSCLLDEGFDVLGISRSAELSDCFLPYKWREQENSFKFFRFDLNHQLDEIIKLIKSDEPNYIVNFSAQSMVAQSWDSPEDWYNTNVVSTSMFHNELRKLDFLKRYVHITTPEVYGNTSGYIKENAPFNPSTPYAVSRLAGDLSLKIYSKEFGIPSVFTRAANVYGPGQQLYRIIPRTILGVLTGTPLQLHGGGLSKRSFIHIDDVSTATLKIMQNGVNNETYHISTEEIVSIKAVVEIICEIMGVRFEANVEFVGERVGKDANYMLDSTKLTKEMDWAPKISLHSGIEGTINWVEKNFSELRNLPLNYIHKK